MKYYVKSFLEAFVATNIVLFWICLFGEGNTLVSVLRIYFDFWGSTTVGNGILLFTVWPILMLMAMLVNYSDSQEKAIDVLTQGSKKALEALEEVKNSNEEVAIQCKELIREYDELSEQNSMLEQKLAEANRARELLELELRIRTTGTTVQQPSVRQLTSPCSLAAAPAALPETETAPTL